MPWQSVPSGNSAFSPATSLPATMKQSPSALVRLISLAPLCVAARWWSSRPIYQFCCVATHPRCGRWYACTTHTSGSRPASWRGHHVSQLVDDRERGVIAVVPLGRVELAGLALDIAQPDTLALPVSCLVSEHAADATHDGGLVEQIRVL